MACCTAAAPGNDYCGGSIAIIQAANDYACMCDCLHVDDVAEILKTHGLDVRPESKEIRDRHFARTAKDQRCAGRHRKED